MSEIHKSHMKARFIKPSPKLLMKPPAKTVMSNISVLDKCKCKMINVGLLQVLIFFGST